MRDFILRHEIGLFGFAVGLCAIVGVSTLYFICKCAAAAAAGAMRLLSLLV